MLSVSRAGAQRLALSICFGFFWSGCSEPLSDDECTQLLDRYTEKVIDQARPSTSQSERSELIFETRQRAKFDPEFSKCSARVSRAEFECAMQAGNADQIERCLL